MKKRTLAALALAVGIILSGCASTESAPGTTPTIAMTRVPVAATPAPTPTAPAAMATGTVTVGDGLNFTVDIATTSDEVRQGLSGREGLPAGTGMLFIFGTSGPMSVWMPDMSFPIDVAWIIDNTVYPIGTLQPCPPGDKENCPKTNSPGAVDGMLEVPAGALAGIPEGTPITLTRD